MYLGGNLRWTGAPELWYYGLSKEKTGNLHCIHARKFSCDVCDAHLNTLILAIFDALFYACR